jgi:hypothetical protein
MVKTALIWVLGSAVVILAGMLLASVSPQAGAVVTVVGILGLVGFLFYVWRVAVTTNDQWVWQTPGKPRREYLAERAAMGEPAATRDEEDHAAEP